MSIKIEKIWVGGFEGAMRGMRNPKNSWDKSDSQYFSDSLPNIGPNDKKLAHTLFVGGSEHRKYLRMCHIQMDVTAPLYWWKEYDTYKVATATNSCSTMHKIHAKEFGFEDFSWDHLLGPGDENDNSTPFGLYHNPQKTLASTIEMLNVCRSLYLETKDKKYWWQMIQLLPSSYNQKRTVDLNYETAATIIRQRSGHKLDEWHVFVDALKKLPYMKEFMEGEEQNE